jgi:hypothetical protein
MTIRLKSSLDRFSARKDSLSFSLSLWSLRGGLGGGGKGFDMRISTSIYLKLGFVVGKGILGSGLMTDCSNQSGSVTSSRSQKHREGDGVLAKLQLGLTTGCSN